MHHLRPIFKAIASWFDNSTVNVIESNANTQSIDLWRVFPFIFLHLACLVVIFVGWSWFAVCFAIGLYCIRMFAITAFYHRYFSHKSFQTSRFCQCVFAVIAGTAVQRGPLWWASHHRNHHIHSDQKEDVHSPGQHGLLWSHTGWFLSSENFATQFDRVKDLAKFPELIFLDRFDVVVPIFFAASIFLLGRWLEASMPQLNTNGWQLFIWGFVISTVCLYHATFSVNSVAHLWGKRPYKTRDQSRNNFLIAILTFGEGWHNNHHYYPGSARQGFHWWQVDITYYGLRVLAMLGIIWNLRLVPNEIRDSSK